MRMRSRKRFRPEHPIRKLSGYGNRVRERAPTEHQEQATVLNWMVLAFPEAERFMAAVPNGTNKSKVARSRFKAEGLKPGYPDLLLDLPRGPYHGLRIEMKRQAKSMSAVSDDQIMWQERLEQQGYRSVICYGHSEAEAEITAYMNLGEFDVVAYLEMWYGINPYDRDELTAVLKRIVEEEDV